MLLPPRLVEWKARNKQFIDYFYRCHCYRELLLNILLGGIPHAELLDKNRFGWPYIVLVKYNAVKDCLKVRIKHGGRSARASGS